MAVPQAPLSPVPWELDGVLRVKVEDEDASLPQVQLCGPGHVAHPEEAARLRFRRFRYEETSDPHEALAQLRELCRQWLRPEAHSKEQMLELLVLEQFLGALPPKVQAWVGAQCPRSGKEAAMLVEDLTQALDRKGGMRETFPSTHSQPRGSAAWSCSRKEQSLGTRRPSGAGSAAGSTFWTNLTKEMARRRGSNGRHHHRLLPQGSVSSQEPRGPGFDSRSGQLARFRAQSPVEGVQEAADQ